MDKYYEFKKGDITVEVKIRYNAMSKVREFEIECGKLEIRVTHLNKKGPQDKFTYTDPKDIKIKNSKNVKTNSKDTKTDSKGKDKK